MVIFYDKTTKEIHHTEEGVLFPVLPYGTLIEKQKYYDEQNLNFVGLPYEFGFDIHRYKLCFDTEGNFQGIQPK